jgi:hypothetical protein
MSNTADPNKMANMIAAKAKMTITPLNIEVSNFQVFLTSLQKMYVLNFVK